MRKTFHQLLRGAFRSLGLAFAAICLQMSFASSRAAEDLPDDPPGRVARLNQIDGPVSFSPAGTDDWANATPNRPLTAGDRVWADKGARSELHVGSTAMRLGASTSMEILDLGDQDMQLKVTQGTFSLRVRDLERDETVEIDTPNIAFVIKEPGEYRFDVNPDRDTTTVTVRRGSGIAYGSDSDPSVPVKTNRLLTFSGDDLFYSVSENAPPRDVFDRWTAQRDEREDDARSARYVSRDMTGYEDLDDNGEWQETREYGPVWIPRVTLRNWAPYHYGHWAWIAPWGWTWVDDERWGFAPFHYGRWAHIHDRWAWVPGPRVSRPVYAPALVGFVGGDRNGGSRWGVSISVGLPGIAWFALAPGEHYRPAYTSNPRYITNINRTIVVHKTVVHNDIYINQRIPHAIAAMPAKDFVSGRSAHEHRRDINQDRMRDFSKMPAASSLPVAPVRQSITGNAQRAQNAPPARFSDHKVVARRQAPEAPVFHDRLARKFSENGEVRGAGPAFTPTARPTRAEAALGRESRDGPGEKRAERSEEGRDARREEGRDDRRENKRNDGPRNETRAEVPRPPQRALESAPARTFPPRDHQRENAPADSPRERVRDIARPAMQEPRRDAVPSGGAPDEERKRMRPGDGNRAEQRSREERQRVERPAPPTPAAQQASPAVRIDAPAERRSEVRPEVQQAPRSDVSQERRQERRDERRDDRREERREEARPQPRPEIRQESGPEPKQEQRQEQRQERQREVRENRPTEERRPDSPRDEDRRQRPQDGERRQHRN